MNYLEYIKGISKNKPVVGYFDTYFPEEFIYALSMHPVRIMSDEEEPNLSNSYIQGFCCPYAKNILEQGLSGKLNFLSAVFFTRYCDSLRGVFEVWKSEKLSPYVGYIRYTQVTKDSAIDYMIDEFLSVFNDFGKKVEKKLNVEDLKEGVKLVNNKRKALKRLYEDRKKGILNLSAKDFYSVVFSATFLEPEDFFRRVNNIGLGEKKDGVKVVLSATELDNLKFFELLDNIGYHVVSDDISSGTRYFKDLVEEEGDNLRDVTKAIAKRYIKKPPCSVKEPSDRRIDELLYEVKSSMAKGVIFYRASFCDSEGVEYPFIKERLEKEGIPHIYIESDHRLSNYQQIRTRLEAFHEQIGDVF